jgi:hypothetical protein
MKGYVLGGAHFGTKADIRKHVQAIKTQYAGGPVSDRNAVAVLRDLLNWHPHREEKLRRGCLGFFVVADVERGGRTFHFAIEAADRALVHFSYNTCINGKAKAHADRVKQAARMAIAPQVAHFKNLYLEPGMRCPLTDEVLTSVNCLRLSGCLRIGSRTSSLAIAGSCDLRRNTGRRCSGNGGHGTASVMGRISPRHRSVTAA